MAENVGSQDQIAASYGGFNLIHFLRDGEFKVEPVILSPERKNLLNEHLMLFFTGFSRIASDIAKDQVNNINKNTGELLSLRAMVDEAIKILSSDMDIRLFGELLHESWLCKQSLSDKISNHQINSIYELAKKSGAIGGKLLGAGGGGFMLLFVEPEKQSHVRSVLHEFIHVPFKFESAGSQIIHFDQ
jgi:D-glycero-alpha-D-manno-heptose-7-phosphate kinase